MKAEVYHRVLALKVVHRNWCRSLGALVRTHSCGSRRNLNSGFEVVVLFSINVLLYIIFLHFFSHIVFDQTLLLLKSTIISVIHNQDEMIAAIQCYESLHQLSVLTFCSCLLDPTIAEYFWT